MEYDFEKYLRENKMDMSIIAARRFACALREAIRVLDLTAGGYSLTKKAYYIETKEFLEKQLARFPKEPSDEDLY